MLVRFPILGMLLTISCASGEYHNSSVADEKYGEKYATGDRGRVSNFNGSSFGGSNWTTNSGSGAGIMAAALLIPAICNQIDRATSAKDQSVKCESLFRTLSETDAAAYEWQSYFLRCNRM